MKNYFKLCTTLDDARKLYKVLSFQLHPDVSGYESTADFQEMQNQFHAFRPTEQRFEGEFDKFDAAQFMHIIDKLVTLEGLEIEICGTFIWLGGNTKENKEAIKEIEPGQTFRKAQWHRTKAKWYFSPSGYFKRSNNELTMEDIRNVYGSKIWNEGNPVSRNRQIIAV